MLTKEQMDEIRAQYELVVKWLPFFMGDADRLGGIRKAIDSIPALLADNDELRADRDHYKARAEAAERRCECGCRRETVSVNDSYKCRMIYMRDDWYLESVNGRGDRQEMVIESPCLCPWCGGTLPSKEEIEQDLDEFVQSIIDMTEGERRI